MNENCYKAGFSLSSASSQLTCASVSVPVRVTACMPLRALPSVGLIPGTTRFLSITDGTLGWSPKRRRGSPQHHKVQAVKQQGDV